MKDKDILRIIENQKLPDRKPWMYKEMTYKQFWILEKKIPLELLDKLDRGGATAVISGITAMEREVYAYSFPDIGENFLDNGDN